MTPAEDLAILRRAYAKQVLAAANVSDARLEAAFATVKREDFLGPGPWPILRWMTQYVPTPDADPVHLYTNDLVGIVPEKRINNGQPSLHAILIHAAAPRSGEHAVHIGAGVGYYSAILAELVGPPAASPRSSSSQSLPRAPRPISPQRPMCASSPATAPRPISTMPTSSTSTPARQGPPTIGLTGSSREGG